MALDIVNPWQRAETARLLRANRIPRQPDLSRNLASLAADALAKRSTEWTERWAFEFIAETLATNRKLNKSA